ncbi:Cobyric acid synthase [hydrothermal vent metagenome]|uniref:Cobyric acid synthase n=1 Tax=hydrothermal vent metagenome TaxID=652676 RepID=A0A1W1D3R7_9ZZZZ
MKSLSIFGTSSDAGKSTIAFALTYLLHKKGIKVAPFKAQNVSNNSQVTDDGGEIAMAQYFAADAIGLQTISLMNPILLKSASNAKSHMIILGKSVSNVNVWEYYRDMKKLKPIVKKAYTKLAKEFDVIVAEGAGSPVELNLMEKDLSNLYIAKEFQTKIILVADIQRGGVFASIYGVYHLLPKELQKNVIGVIINKFQGDMRLFDDGVKIIEEKFHIPVLGVIPWKPFNLGFEDSASLMNYTQNIKKAKIKVGVVKLPHMSNFTDFEPLVADDEVELTFISHSIEASSYDMVIIPGTKLVIEDLLWMKERGFASIIMQKKIFVVAICGGYEMMFQKIIDPFEVESLTKETQGFGRLKGEVVFQKEKIVKKGIYKQFGVMVYGYEIHNGTTKKRSKIKKNFFGTFVHGIFESDDFRYKLFSHIYPDYKGYSFAKYKKNAIEDFTNHIEKNINFHKIQQAIS